MSGAGTDDIQLHFCPVCGVSIPQADIDAGRAKIEPDTCAFYAEPGKCPVKLPRSDSPAPAAAAPTTAAAGARRTGGGVGVLWGVALVWVVGVTTFLLVKEVTRKAPDLVLKTPVATAEDVQGLARKVDAVDDQSRKALAQLKSNDNLQREDLAKLNRGLNQMQRGFEDHVAQVRTQTKDLQDSIVLLGDRTVGLSKDARDILRKLNELEVRADSAPPPQQPPPIVKNPGEPNKTKKKDPTSRNPPTIDPETRKQVDKFVKQLLDPSVDKQTRFNAAVQLGDLMDPSSVPALVTALKKDRYDLVRRAAAYSLGMLGKHSVPAIPDLIQQMDDKEEYVGYMCERALGDITKAVLGSTVSFGFDPTMSAKRRREVQQKWQKWWEKNKEDVMGKVG